MSTGRRCWPCGSDAAGGRWNAPRAEAGMVTVSAGCGLVVPSESETRVYKKWSGGMRRATTLCIMSAGGDELFWHWVSYPPRRSRACEASGYSGDTPRQLHGNMRQHDRLLRPGLALDVEVPLLRHGEIYTTLATCFASGLTAGGYSDACTGSSLSLFGKQPIFRSDQRLDKSDSNFVSSKRARSRWSSS